LADYAGFAGYYATPFSPPPLLLIDYFSRFSLITPLIFRFAAIFRRRFHSSSMPAISFFRCPAITFR
jgi:hypothetical protein